eukprot:2575996-Rhodomonas_salina.3
MITTTVTASCHITGRGIMIKLRVPVRDEEGLGGAAEEGERGQTLESVGAAPHLSLPHRKLLQVLLLLALDRPQTPHPSMSIPLLRKDWAKSHRDGD